MGSDWNRVKDIAIECDHFVGANKMVEQRVDNDSPTMLLIEVLESDCEWVIDEIAERYTGLILKYKRQMADLKAENERYRNLYCYKNENIHPARDLVEQIISDYKKINDATPKHEKEEIMMEASVKVIGYVSDMRNRYDKHIDKLQSELAECKAALIHLFDEVNGRFSSYDNMSDSLRSVMLEARKIFHTWHIHDSEIELFQHLKSRDYC